MTIEGWTGHPQFNDLERQLWIESMRKAGFPVCASENTLQAIPSLVRLPECVRMQATN